MFLFGGGNIKIFPIWLKVLIVIVELIIHASAIFMIILILNSIYGDCTVKLDAYNLENFNNSLWLVQWLWGIQNPD